MVINYFLSTLDPFCDLSASSPEGETSISANFSEGLKTLLLSSDKDDDKKVDGDYDDDDDSNSSDTSASDSSINIDSFLGVESAPSASSCETYKLFGDNIDK